MTRKPDLMGKKNHSTHDQHFFSSLNMSSSLLSLRGVWQSQKIALKTQKSQKIKNQEKIWKKFKEIFNQKIKKKKKTLKIQIFFLEKFQIFQIFTFFKFFIFIDFFPKIPATPRHSSPKISHFFLL